MRIVLSETLSRHFSELWFSEYPNVDRLLALAARYQQAGDPEWVTLRCAAKLVADEVLLLRPDYNSIAKQPGSADGLRWLEEAVAEPGGGRSPNPSLLADSHARLRFLRERLEAERTRGTSPHDAAEISARVDGFVNPLMAPIADPVKPALFLSPDPVFNRASLEMTSTLTAENILAALATAGIRIVMPGVSVTTDAADDINYAREDEMIAEVREKFDAERQAYVDGLRKFIKDCYEGLKGGLYQDVFDYADKATNQEMMVQVRGFEAAVRHADKKLLERIKVGAIEGLPSIAEAAVDPKKSVMAQTGIELLRVLSKSFGERSAYREACERFPLASYAFRVRSHAAGARTS